MRIPVRTILAASLAVTGALAASADKVELTSAEKAQVSQACKIGLPLIPVSSDYGHDTGEFALPLSESDGEVHTALIVSANDLKEIDECKAEITAFAERSSDGEDAVS